MTNFRENVPGAPPGSRLLEGERDADAFQAECLADVRHHWAEVRTPDADPLPRVYIYHPGNGVVAHEIELEWFTDSDTIGVLWGHLRDMAVEVGVTRLAVSNVMIVAPATPREQLTPEQRSRDRRGLIPEGGKLIDRDDSWEIAALTIVDADGCTMVQAPITRSDSDPPALGEWEPLDGMKGRLADIGRSMPR